LAPAQVGHIQDAGGLSLANDALAGVMVFATPERAIVMRPRGPGSVEKDLVAIARVNDEVAIGQERADARLLAKEID
jgi:hypothetical protein